MLYDEPLLHHFVCLRLLMKGEREISEASQASLPVVLQDISARVETIGPITLLKEARLLADSTPRSFLSLLERACWGGNTINEKVMRFEKQSLMLVLKCVGTWSCLPISADEAIGFALKDWGVVKNPSGKNAKTLPRFHQGSGGNSASRLDAGSASSGQEQKGEAGQEIDRQQSDDKLSYVMTTRNFPKLPSYLTSPESVQSATSSICDEDSDVESNFSGYDNEEHRDEDINAEISFSDEEGDRGEESKTCTAPSSPLTPTKNYYLAQETPMSPNTATLSANIEQRRQSKRKYVLLDCRTRKEYDECHIYGSIHLDEKSWLTGEVRSIVQNFNDMKVSHRKGGVRIKFPRFSMSGGQRRLTFLLLIMLINSISDPPRISAAVIHNMQGCHFALIGSGPSSFDLQMSVNAHRCGPSNNWKRKQRLKNQASKVVHSSENFFKRMVAATSETLKLRKDDDDKFVPRNDDNDGYDPENMQVGAIGEEDLAVSRWVCMFLQHDFQYISYVRGGIKACIRELKNADKADGVGLAEGAESVLEGTAVVAVDGGDRGSKSKSRTDSFLKEMVDCIGVDLSPGTAQLISEAKGGNRVEEPSNIQRKSSGLWKSTGSSERKKSQEGATKKGWDIFIGKIMERSSLSPTFGKSEEQSSTRDDDDDDDDNDNDNDDTENRNLGDNQNRGESTALTKAIPSCTPSPPLLAATSAPYSSARQGELNQIRGELESHLNAAANSPNRRTPKWVKRLSMKTAEAGTALLLASQKLGENIKKNATNASPRNSSLPNDIRLGTGHDSTKEKYYISKLVDISQWIMSESEKGSSPVQTFSATLCSTAANGPAESPLMLPCQLLISPRHFMALEMKMSTPGCGSIVELREIDALSKITTVGNEHGLVNFHFNRAARDGTSDNLGSSNEDVLRYVVEDYRSCITLLKLNFALLKAAKGIQSKNS